MRLRCDNPQNKDYVNYGGRGISYCPTWKNYDVFVLDMGECPEGLTLERLNNNLNYSKDNCKWASRQEQNRNRRVRSTCKTGVPGVYFYRGQCFQVYGDLPGKRLYLGSTKDFFEAVCRRKSFNNKGV